MSRRIGLDIAWFAAVALAAGTLVAWGTRVGLGLSPDSASYVAAARGLLEGRGVVLPGPPGRSVPLTHYPPLLPAALAAIGLFGPEVLAAARWLNVAVFAGNAFLAALVVYRHSRSRWAGLLAAALTGASLATVRAHTMLLSEPLFLLLVLAMTGLLAAHARRPRPAVLLAAGVAGGLAGLARYVGVFCAVAGTAWLLLGRRPRRRKLAEAAVFAVLSAGPPLAWMWRNIRLAGTAVNRRSSFHPPGVAHLKEAFRAINDWILPADTSHGVLGLRAAAMVILVAMAGLLVWQALRRTGRPQPGGTGPQEAAADRLPGLLGIELVSYLLALLGAIAFTDPTLRADERMLMPAMMMGLPAVICLGWRLARLGPVSRGARALAAAACVVLVLTQLSPSLAWLDHVRRQGHGYSGGGWRSSPTMAQVAALPKDTLIYTNGPDAVYLLTGRAALFLPARPRGQARQQGKLTPGLADMAASLEAHGGVVVCFDRVQWRPYLPGGDELQQQLGLELIQRCPDGALYRLAKRR